MVKRKYFGTDGIRGEANLDAITAHTILDLALATARYFKNGSHRHKVVIGKDTRLSGYMLESTLTAGFISMGFDVYLLGPLPTPAVSMLTTSLRADFGVMISASHNHAYDNGVKIFTPGGCKLSDTDESIIEKYMEDSEKQLVHASKLGSARRLDGAHGRYVEMVKRVMPRGLRLDGMKIVLDCANGAAYRVAPDVFYELGAEVILHANQPDGCNINDNCGALYPDVMQNLVLEHNAAFGISLDGDGDRLIMCDEHGRLMDGDMILAILAHDMQKKNILRAPVVLTVMANFGLENNLISYGIQVVRCGVGDRTVAQTMQEFNSNLGGETSGHIILGDFSMTGDGIVAALGVASVIAETKKPLSEFAYLFQPCPQLLRNIRYSGICPLDNPFIKESIDQIISDTPENYRVLVRPSGTESMIRVMVEGKELDTLNVLLNRIESVFYMSS